MRPHALSRRSFLQAAGLGAGATAVAAVSPIVGAAFSAAAAASRTDIGVTVHPFPLSAVSLLAGPFLDNLNRTLKYLTFLDADRLLHTFRLNYGLPSTAKAVGGWDAPTHDLRGHTTGHLMTALAQAYANTGQTAYQTKGDYLVTTLAACQARATSRGFRTGYLSAFPESQFDKVETAQRVQAPYYTIHKIMAGLLDMHMLAGNVQALTVLQGLAGWVKARTDTLTGSKLTNTMSSEFGGIGEVLINLYQLTGNSVHLTVARRFVEPGFLDPLASDQDSLHGLHANMHTPTILAALRDYHASGVTRNRDIAVNFWNILTSRYAFVIGGSSTNEFWRNADQIAGQLTDNDCEGCVSYNTLKISRQLFFTLPDQSKYLDFYEKALYNHILGQQDPTAANGGGYAYFTPLRAGAIKTYSTDYNTFTCCQGTGMESNTKYADSIYFYSGETLYVNLFIASQLNWPGRGLTVRQDTTFPNTATSRLTITGSGHIALKVRVPTWTSAMTVKINGQTQTVTATPGSYLTIDRTWASGDVVDLSIPARLTYPRANDNAGLGSALYGPIVLAGQYGTTDLNSVNPTLQSGTLKKASGSALKYTGTASTGGITLSPLYLTHHQRYAAYWNIQS